jgi:predicted nucleic acid-binding protein
MDALWIDRIGRISWQVMVELYNNLRRKVHPVISDSDARRIVERYLPWQPIVTDLALFRRAWALQDSYSLSWWDALVVAAANVAGCRYLLSEDMHYDGELDGVRLISPFEHTPGQILHA